MKWDGLAREIAIVQSNTDYVIHNMAYGGYIHTSNRQIKRFATRQDAAAYMISRQLNASIYEITAVKRRVKNE